MRVASFNLETLSTGPVPEGADLATRVAVLRPQLLRLRADVLCLQEVDGARVTAKAPRTLPALDALLDGTPYAAYHRASTRTDGESARDKHNLVILSRFAVRSERQHANDLVAGVDVPAVTGDTTRRHVTWDRPILHAELALPNGRSLHVINVHLRAPLASHIPDGKLGPLAWRSVAAWGEGFFLSAVKRSGQALETRLLVERIFDSEPEALIAVCGDFNAENGEMPVRLIVAGEDDTGNGALATRALVPLDRAIPRSLRFSTIHNGQPQMVDHIVVSSGLLATFSAIEVHNETLSDESIGPLTVERSPHSYHAPLVATFDRALDAALGAPDR